MDSADLVSCRVGERLKEVRVGYNADLAVRHSLSEALYSCGMGEQHMVAHPPVVCGVFVPRSMCPDVVPNLCHTLFQG